MAIFERLADLVKSNVNDLIDRAENPEKMVKQVIIDMEEQIQKATVGYGQAKASLNQMKKQLDGAKASSAEWENKAKLALSNNNPDLAKQALNKKVEYDNLVGSYQQNYDNMALQVDNMKLQLEELKKKLEEARNQQQMLIARSKMADAQSTISKSFSSNNNKNVFAKMDKMEAKIEAKEAEASAFTEMGEDSVSLDDQFKEMENSSTVDAELERLRKEMGL